MPSRRNPTKNDVLRVPYIDRTRSEARRIRGTAPRQRQQYDRERSAVVALERPVTVEHAVLRCRAAVRESEHVLNGGPLDREHREKHDIHVRRGMTFFVGDRGDTAVDAGRDRDRPGWIVR